VSNTKAIKAVIGPALEELVQTAAIAIGVRHRNKQPTWLNTVRDSTTSAYSLTGFPASTGLPII
jgi:hypothetical protein